jgi:hypothetical protein
MKSFLKQIESKFIELKESVDETETQDVTNEEEELDEMSGTGGVAGYNIPAAFAKPGKWRNKSKTYESVNTPPNWKLGEYQAPEDEEEEYTDKFPFAEDEKIWQHKNYKYPSMDLRNTPGISKRKDKTKNNIKPSVAETMDAKYEKLIESYRAFATGDAKSTPEQKIKHTIKEVAKKLQEIEQTVNYASRLKTESGIARNGYGSSVEKALNKISERLIKISERVRALGE